MAVFYLKFGAAAYRTNSTAYSVGTVVSIPRTDTQTNHATFKKWVYECTTAGTSGAAPPAYSLSGAGATVTDGTVVWTVRDCFATAPETDNWKFASPHFDYIASRLATGDQLRVSHAHAENVGVAALVATFAGTGAAPNIITCVNDVTGALATTASITATSSSSININGSVYVYGINLNIGTATTAVSINFATTAVNAIQEWERCTFFHGSTASSVQYILIGSSGVAGGRRVTWTNCDVKFAGTGGVIGTGCGNLIWNGGSVLAGSVTPTTLFATQRTGPYQGDITVTGVDFSNLGANVTFFATASVGNGELRNCKLPANWNGGISQTVVIPAARFKMHNCDSSDTKYKYLESDALGTVSAVTSVYRTGGAETDGVPFSMYVEGSSNNNFHVGRFKSKLLPVWVTAGTPVTLKYNVACNTPASDLTTRQAWLELAYPSDSTTPLAAFAIGSADPLLENEAVYPVDGTGWVGVNPTFYRTDHTMSITFTPVNSGWVQPQLVVTTNRIIYIDPKPQVT